MNSDPHHHFVGGHDEPKIRGNLKKRPGVSELDQLKGLAIDDGRGSAQRNTINRHGERGRGDPLSSQHPNAEIQSKARLPEVKDKLDRLGMRIASLNQEHGLESEPQHHVGHDTSHVNHEPIKGITASDHTSGKHGANHRTVDGAQSKTGSSRRKLEHHGTSPEHRKTSKKTLGHGNGEFDKVRDDVTGIDHAGHRFRQQDTISQQRHLVDDREMESTAAPTGVAPTFQFSGPYTEERYTSGARKGEVPMKANQDDQDSRLIPVTPMTEKQVGPGESYSSSTAEDGASVVNENVPNRADEEDQYDEYSAAEEPISTEADEYEQYSGSIAEARNLGEASMNENNTIGTGEDGRNSGSIEGNMESTSGIAKIQNRADEDDEYSSSIEDTRNIGGGSVYEKTHMTVDRDGQHVGFHEERYTDIALAKESAHMTQGNIHSGSDAEVPNTEVLPVNEKVPIESNQDDHYSVSTTEVDQINSDNSEGSRNTVDDEEWSRAIGDKRANNKGQTYEIQNDSSGDPEKTDTITEHAYSVNVRDWKKGNVFKDLEGFSKAKSYNAETGEYNDIHNDLIEPEKENELVNEGNGARTNVNLISQIGTENNQPVGTADSAINEAENDNDVKMNSQDSHHSGTRNGQEKEAKDSLQIQKEVRRKVSLLLHLLNATKEGLDNMTMYSKRMAQLILSQPRGVNLTDITAKVTTDLLKSMFNTTYRSSKKAELGEIQSLPRPTQVFVWTTWGDWTPCSVTCGDGGVRQRIRHCEKTGACSDTYKEMDHCHRVEECESK